MRKTTIRNLIHFILIIIPIFMLFICVLQPLKNTDGGDITTDTHTQNVIEYYQTNEVNDVNDLINGNVYAMDLYQINVNAYFLIDNVNFSCIDYNLYPNSTVIDDITTPMRFNSIINASFYSTQSEYCYIYYGGNNDNYFSYQLEFNGNFNSYFWVIMKEEYRTSIDLESSIDDGFIYNNIQVPQVFKSVSQQIIEGTRYNYDLIRPFETFYNLNINSWYNNVLDLIGLENNSRISNYIFHYPLYLMWFFLFEIIEIVLTAVPKLIIHICKKIGGEEV